MADAQLEHTNITVSDPKATAAWLDRVFGWKIRWQGKAINGGHTIHVGSDDTYLALYSPPEPVEPPTERYVINGSLNHVGVLVDDIDTAETQVRAAGFTPVNHADYEPGRRFYFFDNDRIEFEVISYSS